MANQTITHNGLDEYFDHIAEKTEKPPYHRHFSNDNIISDKNTLEHVDGLNLNKLQNSKDLSWLRFRRNKILHYEGPIEGFYKSLDSLKVIKLDVDRADKVLHEFLSELFG